MRVGMVIVALSTMALTGCGGSVDAERDTGQDASGAKSSSSGSGDPCASTTARVTNLRALELIACTGEVAATARLVSVSSSGGGTLDTEGTDDDWIAWFIDEANGRAFGARVVDGVAEIELQPSDRVCEGEPLTILDSEIGRAHV